MFWQILLFEIKYRLKRPDTWFYFFTFFVIVTLAFANGVVPENDKTIVNSPIVLTKFFTIYSFFMTIVTAAIMGTPLYKDLEYNTHAYYLSFPISRNGYFLGRFFGSFLFVILIGSTLLMGSILGVFLGRNLGWLNANKVMAFNLWIYLKPFLTFALPNLFLTSCVFFALVAFTRNIKVVYWTAVMFYLGYAMSIFVLHFFDNKSLIYYLDAFGFTPVLMKEQYLSAEQLNHLVIPLSGMMAVNRLLWFAIAVLIIVYSWSRFRFHRFFGDRSYKKKKNITVQEELTADKELPHVPVYFSARNNWKLLFELAKIEWLSMLRDNYFRLIIAAGIIFLGLIFWLGPGEAFNAPELPRTTVLLDIYINNFTFFIFLIVLFFTGEAIHREKNTRFAIIRDTLPPANWMLYGSKLLGLFYLALLLASIPIVTGIFIQLIKGYSRFDLTSYFTICYGLSLPLFIEMVIFCFVVHVLVNNRFAGHTVALIVWILMLLSYSSTRFDYSLLLYSYTPEYWLTDMGGLGPSIASQLFFNIYWLLAGGILIVVAGMFYCRGIVFNFSQRIREAVNRFDKVPRKITLALLAGFLAVGAYNYFNVSWLNRWLLPSEKNERAAIYEKQLKKYQDLPMPVASRLRLFMDIFPDDRKAITNAFVTIINNSGKPIHEVLMDGNQFNSYWVKCNGNTMSFTSPLTYSWPAFTFFKPGRDTSMWRLYKFPKPLYPGDTALLQIHTELAKKGYSNNIPGISSVEHNGTAYFVCLPQFGYNKQLELWGDLKRKQYNLPAKNNLSYETGNAGAAAFSSPVDFESTISTSANQTAIAPGILSSSWTIDNRRYFHYYRHSPGSFFPFPVLSARYAIQHEQVTIENGKKVDIYFYYYPEHTTNLNRFMTAYKDGMRRFSHAFGCFPVGEMRLVEGPAWINTGDFANLMVYGENYAWNTGLNNPDQADYCYFFTAYHLGFQWWKFQGIQPVSDGLSKYGAYIAYEEKFRKNAVTAIARQQIQRYLSDHRFKFKTEKPLINAAEPYICDIKAGIFLYGLKELIGEDSLNAALREFRDQFGSGGNFSSANNALFQVLEKYVPDSLKYYLNDGWKKIAIYDNKILKAAVIPTGKPNEYKVRVEYRVRKLYSDSTGVEKEAAYMNDYIDVGIFAANHPLYVKKCKLSAGNHVFEWIVKEKPAHVAIDPYCYLIDNNMDDNLLKF